MSGLPLKPDGSESKKQKLTQVEKLRAVGSPMARTNSWSVGANQIPSMELGLTSNSPALIGSCFKRATGAAPDPIFAVRDAFLADTALLKLNLAVGVYRTAEGKPLVLKAVQSAEESILARQGKGAGFKEYLPMDGMPAFNKVAPLLLLGKGPATLAAQAEGKLVSVQSLSGTGGLFLAAHVIARHMPGRTVYLPTPTWPIHTEIFGGAGLTVKYYRYYDPKTCGLDMEGLSADLKAAEAGSIIVLHACAHNPSGVDPTTAQWGGITELVAAKRFVPLVDAAYQGLASGSFDKDGEGTRLLASIPKVEMMCVQSFSKIMGLYSERCGCFSFLSQDGATAERVRQEVCKHVRMTYSSPPSHGAAIATEILSDATRFESWAAEVGTMSSRITGMRTSLHDALVANGCPPPSGTSHGSWGHILSQSGMFSFTGLTAAQTDHMQKNNAVYLLRDGRISMSGLNHETCQHLAMAMKAAIVALPAGQ